MRTLEGFFPTMGFPQVVLRACVTIYHIKKTYHIIKSMISCRRSLGWRRFTVDHFLEFDRRACLADRDALAATLIEASCSHCLWKQKFGLWRSLCHVSADRRPHENCRRLRHHVHPRILPALLSMGIRQVHHRRHRVSLSEHHRRLHGIYECKVSPLLRSGVFPRPILRINRNVRR